MLNCDFLLNDCTNCNPVGMSILRYDYFTCQNVSLYIRALQPHTFLWLVETLCKYIYSCIQLSTFLIHQGFTSADITMLLLVSNNLVLWAIQSTSTFPSQTPTMLVVESQHHYSSQRVEFSFHNHSSQTRLKNLQARHNLSHMKSLIHK